jgi:hypothetical protein
LRWYCDRSRGETPERRETQPWDRAERYSGQQAQRQREHKHRRVETNLFSGIAVEINPR